LSGANRDGALGLAAIHDAGGITMVQEPDTAAAPSMALSALKLRSADWVLPLEKIANLLRTLN
jgi:two-component system, chemotaxis family, protein-glutamate methylesterase/glutaminase